MKLNIGSGGTPISGYTGIDLHVPADIQGDFMLMNFTDVEAVEMAHVLEHISHHLTTEALARVRSWMRPGAPIRVEVPDCAQLLMIDPTEERWPRWWFGSQDHAGEVHLTGFVEATLALKMHTAGFRDVLIRAFRSPEACRLDYPCLEARAVA